MGDVDHPTRPIRFSGAGGMTLDMVRTVLGRRPWVPANTLLDCLDLAEWLEPHIRAQLTPLVTTAELQARWNCSQSAVSRRVSALIRHGLIDATMQGGRGAYWAVHCVGPAA
jgi:hypothetical protein